VEAFGVGAAIKYGAKSASAARGGFGFLGIFRGGGKVASGPKSNTLRQLYLQEVSFSPFKWKLRLHNILVKAGTLGRSKWVSVEDIRLAITKSAEFRLDKSTVHLRGRRYIFGGRESSRYLNRTVTHHELLYVGQYLRNPGIRDGGIIGIAHEVAPAFIGTPEYLFGAIGALSGGVYASTVIWNRR
jgi:hypothetical protein